LAQFCHKYLINKSFCRQFLYLTTSIIFYEK